MKCEICGKETDFLGVDMFQLDGSDIWEEHPVQIHENGIFLDLNQNYVGYGMSDEERCDSIRCPYCKRFPLKDKEIQEYEILREVMFTAEREEE